MSRKNASCLKDRQGAAMIIVLCVMAVLMALCASILMAASVTIGTARNRALDERCRIAATTFSVMLREQIEDTVAAEALGQNIADGIADAATFPEGTTAGAMAIQKYLRDTIRKSNPDYNTPNIVGDTEMWPAFDFEANVKGVVKAYQVADTNITDDGYELGVEMSWSADRDTLAGNLETASNESVDKRETERELAYGDSVIGLTVTVTCKKDDRMQKVEMNYILSSHAKSFEGQAGESGGEEKEYVAWEWTRGDVS